MKKIYLFIENTKHTSNLKQKQYLLNYKKK